MVTVPVLQSCGVPLTLAAVWSTPMDAACTKFQINTPQRVAAFLANVGVESGGLIQLSENLNYSAQALANTWPGRYSSTGKAGGAPNSQALGLARDPEAIANDCYANRMGNGPAESGDGWKYRGQGPIQCTGKDVIEAFFTYMGMPVNSDPALLQQPVFGSMSAAWFFTVYKGMNLARADLGNFAATVASVNGQPPCAANDGPRRIAYYIACLGVLKQAS